MCENQPDYYQQTKTLLDLLILMDELPNKLNHFLYIVNNKLSDSIDDFSKENADYLQNYLRLFKNYNLLNLLAYEEAKELLSEIQQDISKLSGDEKNFISSYDSFELDTLHENIQKEFNVNIVYEIIDHLNLKHVIEIEKYLNLFKVTKMISKVIELLRELVWLIPCGKQSEIKNTWEIINLLEKSRDKNLTFDSDKLLMYLNKLTHPEFFSLNGKAKTRLDNASLVKENSEKANAIIVESKLNEGAKQLCKFWNQIIPVEAQLKSIQGDIKEQIKPNLMRLERLLTFKESVDDDSDNSKQIIKYIEDSRYVSNERVYNKETKKLIFELTAALITNYKSVMGKLQDLNSINVGWRDFLSLALNNDKIPTFNAHIRNIAKLIKEEFNKNFNPAKETDYYDKIKNYNRKYVIGQLTHAKNKIIIAQNAYLNSVASNAAYRQQPKPSKRNQQENKENKEKPDSDEPSKEHSEEIPKSIELSEEASKPPKKREKSPNKTENSPQRANSSPSEEKFNPPDLIKEEWEYMIIASTNKLTTMNI
jgi:hypothetical protein